MKIFDLTTIIPKMEGKPVPLPRMAWAHQTYDDCELADIRTEIQNGVQSLPENLYGRRIAVTVGSRGIDRIDQIVRALVDELKAKGAIPFIIPAMGSHAGATSEGQREFFGGYGITEKTMGVEICDSMETVCLGVLPNGVKVFCQKGF